MFCSLIPWKDLWMKLLSECRNSDLLWLSDATNLTWNFDKWSGCIFRNPRERLGYVLKVNVQCVRKMILYCNVRNHFHCLITSPSGKWITMELCNIKEPGTERVLYLVSPNPANLNCIHWLMDSLLLRVTLVQTHRHKNTLSRTQKKIQ